VHRHVHMVGIGGIGMAAIAHVLLEMGVTVSGSDQAASEVTSKLAQSGATVYIGHRQQQVTGASVVVVSTAIPPNNVEVQAAKAAGIPVWHRSQMLAEILNVKYGIAIAGAHGKTTITSMLSWVLYQCGMEPTFVIGGTLPGLGGAHYGTGPMVVAEADESDRSFLCYRPRVAVVSSIEADHLEYYDGQFSRLVETFQQFLSNVVVPDGLAILCADDKNLVDIGEKLSCQVTWYGRHETADYRVLQIKTNGKGTCFQVSERGELLGEFTLAIPGEHNVMNALAVIAICRHLGLHVAGIAAALASFPGAKRRFQIIYEHNNITVVDDYAHHPSEIKATIKAARRGWPNSRLIAVFQPQRYTRTHFLMNDFARAFGETDLVVLTQIYSPPPEEPIPGVSGERLAQLVQMNEPNLPVRYIAERSELAPYLYGEVRPGDIVLIMGAGDIWRTSQELAEKLRA
jgi:UDP-N-acetylmuramate--alanine ligase